MTVNLQAAPDRDGRGKGSTDLHITTGAPPQLRIDGDLVPLQTDAEARRPVETKHALLLDPQRQAEVASFEEEMELDLSFGVKRPRPLPREHLPCSSRARRVPRFASIPYRDSSRSRTLGLPPIVKALICARAAWARARDRPDRLGQEHHARVDDRPSSTTRLRGHIITDRRSDRVPAPATRHLHRSTSARSERDSQVVPQRALKYIAAPGPRRHPARRDA